MPDVSLECARAIDLASSFHPPLNCFSMPLRDEGGHDPVRGYFLGHSLGLAPRYARERVEAALKSWEARGIRGHFDGPNSWYRLDEQAIDPLSRLIGGQRSEVALMNTLTVNIHAMLAAFYRPEGDRSLILMEGGAFPSDRYGVRSQLEVRGLDPTKYVMEVAPRAGEHTLRITDVLEVIETHGEKIALVFLGAVQFASGQVLDVERITAAAKKKGCVVGFDLAHATGNIELRLSEWSPDFAVGCGYKYLNAGAGGGAHIWVNECHVKNPALQHLAGWWGTDPGARFEMEDRFRPRLDAYRFAVSNIPVFSAEAALGGLDVFSQVANDHGGSLEPMWQRREELWQFLYDTVSAIQEAMPSVFEIITPRPRGEHGAMLSILVPGKAEAVEKALAIEGFVVDARSHSIVRISTVPLWTSAEQIHQFGQALRSILSAFV